MWHRSELPVHRHERYVSLYDVQVWVDELARVAQKWATAPVYRHERYVSLYDVQVWDDELARVAQKWSTSAQT